jgi:cathepsin D
VYFSAIGIGSENKQFLVVMDTGSSDLWLPSVNCQDESCQNHETLSSKDSKTFQATKKPWVIQYGSGSASGVIVSDSLSIGGLNISRLSFGVATQVSDNFVHFV